MAGLGLQGAMGSQGAIDAIRKIRQDQLEQEVLAQRQQQLAIENEQRNRQIAVQEGQFGLDQQAAAMPAPTPYHAPTVIKGLQPAGAGGPVTRIMNPTGGFEDVPEAEQVKPEPTPRAPQILRGVRGANGKPVTQMVGPDGTVIREVPEFQEPPKPTAGSGPVSETDQALADMVTKNPDLLDKMSPTQRGAVLRTIAADGGNLTNRRQQMQASVIKSALDTATKLASMPGFAGAVGRKGPMSLFGYLDRPMAGSEAANYAQYFDTLKSQITLPRMEMMRGLGAMSDREFKTLADSGTALTRDLSEPQFKVELGNIIRTLSDIEARGGVLSANAPGLGGAGGNFSVTVGGSVHTFPSQAALDAFKKAAGIR